MMYANSPLSPVGELAGPGGDPSGQGNTGTAITRLNQQGPVKKKLPLMNQAGAQPQQAQQMQQTFAQMQAAGQARPAPPPPAPAPTPMQQQQAPAPVQQPPQQPYQPSYQPPAPYSGGGGVGGATQDMLMQMFRQPSGYGADEVKQWYDRGGQDIDDQYTQDERGMREEMARRGLSDSSVLGGRLADLNVQKRSARQDLADSLGKQFAQDTAAARAAAVSAGTDWQRREDEAQWRQGQLGLDSRKLDQDSAQFEKNYGLDSRKLDINEGQFDKTYDLDQRRDARDDRRLDMDDRQWGSEFGLRKDQFDWDKDGDVMRFLNETDDVATPWADPYTAGGSPNVNTMPTSNEDEDYYRRIYGGG